MDVKETFNKWWADDWHAIPRFWRDLTLNRVGLYILTYNAYHDVYNLDFMHIKRDDLPREAVHLSGAGKSIYYLDKVNTGQYPKPGYMTATDLYLYMVNNDINEANNIKRKRPFILDTKTAGLIAIAAACVVGLIAYRFLLPML